jgi:hypothetical protein
MLLCPCDHQARQRFNRTGADQRSRQDEEGGDGDRRGIGKDSQNVGGSQHAHHQHQCRADKGDDNRREALHGESDKKQHDHRQADYRLGTVPKSSHRFSEHRISPDRRNDRPRMRWSLQNGPEYPG